MWSLTSSSFRHGAVAFLLPPPETGDGDAGKRSRAGRQAQALPTELPRVEHRREPESCECAACGQGLVKIGKDISEQLDVEPACFFVQRHIRPQYACR
jgi:transposase